MDVAMSGTANFDHLCGALMLLARMDPSVSKRALIRADQIEAKHPVMASALRKIAAQLPQAMLNADAQPKKLANLRDPARYLWP